MGRWHGWVVELAFQCGISSVLTPLWGQRVQLSVVAGDVDIMGLANRSDNVFITDLQLSPICK